jgi:hypothetical protein
MFLCGTPSHFIQCGLILSRLSFFLTLAVSVAVCVAGGFRWMRHRPGWMISLSFFFTWARICGCVCRWGLQVDETQAGLDDKLVILPHVG